MPRRKGQTKYEPERVQRILYALQNGASRRMASAYGGISEDTFANWMRRYTDFSDAIKEAEAAAAVGWLAKIEAAANDGHWQAAAWKLERRYPHEYGRRVVDASVSGAMTIRIIDDSADADVDPFAP